MPPRGVYKAKQEEKKKQNRSSRPAQESRSDQREQERQEKANAQKALAQAKERARVALVKSQKEALAKAKEKSKAQSPARGADNAKKIQTEVSKASGPKTTRKLATFQCIHEHKKCISEAIFSISFLKNSRFTFFIYFFQINF